MSGWKTDGSPHIEGIENEKTSLHYIISHPDNRIKKNLKANHGAIKSWKHEGGTKQKRDAMIEFVDKKKIGLSFKNHKAGGTFDWLNTTRISLKFIKELNEAIKYFKKKMKI